jgi:hypothetical protein
MGGSYFCVRTMPCALMSSSLSPFLNLILTPLVSLHATSHYVHNICSIDFNSRPVFVFSSKEKIAGVL